MSFTRITTRAGQMDGVPCIRNLLIPVATVIELIADGLTRKDILAAYPDVEDADVSEALRYAAKTVRAGGLQLGATDEGS